MALVRVSAQPLGCFLMESPSLHPSCLGQFPGRADCRALRCGLAAVCRWIGLTHLLFQSCRGSWGLLDALRGGRSAGTDACLLHDRHPWLWALLQPAAAGVSWTLGGCFWRTVVTWGAAVAVGFITDGRLEWCVVKACRAGGRVQVRAGLVLSGDPGHIPRSAIFWFIGAALVLWARIRLGHVICGGIAIGLGGVAGVCPRLIERGCAARGRICAKGTHRLLLRRRQVAEGAHAAAVEHGLCVFGAVTVAVVLWFFFERIGCAIEEVPATRSFGEVGGGEEKGQGQSLGSFLGMASDSCFFMVCCGFPFQTLGCETGCQPGVSGI